MAVEGALNTDERRSTDSSSESTIFGINCLRTLFFGKEALRENPDEMVAIFGVLPRFFMAGVILAVAIEFSIDCRGSCF